MINMVLIIKKFSRTANSWKFSKDEEKCFTADEEVNTNLPSYFHISTDILAEYFSNKKVVEPKKIIYFDI